MHLALPDEPADWGQRPKDVSDRRAWHLEEVLRQVTGDAAPAAILFGGDHTNRPVSEPAYRRAADDFMRRFPEPRYANPGNQCVAFQI